MADETDPPVDMTEAAIESAPDGQRKRRPWGLLVALLGVLLVGLFLFRSFGPKPVPPPKIVHYSPQQTANAQKALDTLGAELLAPPPIPATRKERRTSARAADGPVIPQGHPPAPEAATVRMQLSQADLNTYLATNPRVKALLASRGIQAVQLLLRTPHNVTCRAAVLFKGRRTNVQIAGSLLPNPDTVARFEATSAQVGALPLPPKTVTAQANRIAGQFVGRMRGRFPIAVQQIQVVGDHLVLTGVRRPTGKG